MNGFINVFTHVFDYVLYGKYTSITYKRLYLYYFCFSEFQTFFNNFEIYYLFTFDFLK